MIKSESSNYFAISDAMAVLLVFVLIGLAMVVFAVVRGLNRELPEIENRLEKRLYKSEKERAKLVKRDEKEELRESKEMRRSVKTKGTA